MKRVAVPLAAVCGMLVLGASVGLASPDRVSGAGAGAGPQPAEFAGLATKAVILSRTLPGPASVSVDEAVEAAPPPADAPLPRPAAAEAAKKVQADNHRAASLFFAKAPKVKSRMTLGIETAAELAANPNFRYLGAGAKDLSLVSSDISEGKATVVIKFSPWSAFAERDPEGNGWIRHRPSRTKLATVTMARVGGAWVVTDLVSRAADRSAP